MYYVAGAVMKIVRNLEIRSKNKYASALHGRRPETTPAPQTERGERGGRPAPLIDVNSLHHPSWRAPTQRRVQDEDREGRRSQLH